MMRIQHYELDGCPVTVIHLWAEPEECNMCGAVGFHEHAVPWYCGPVAEGESEGGYKTVCKTCHDRWARWDDSLARDDGFANCEEMAEWFAAQYGLPFIGYLHQWVPSNV